MRPSVSLSFVAREGRGAVNVPETEMLRSSERLLHFHMGARARVINGA
jgi:hypothetical protein